MTPQDLVCIKILRGVLSQRLDHMADNPQMFTNDQIVGLISGVDTLNDILKKCVEGGPHG